MCQILVISTDKEINIRRYDNPIFTLDKNIGTEPFFSHLKYPYKYMVSHKEEGCSCFIRCFDHAIGYCEPQDWMSEQRNDEDIQSAMLMYNLLSSLLKQGMQVDSVMGWMDLDKNAVVEHFDTVDLSVLPREHFTFFNWTYTEYKLYTRLI